MKAVLRLMLCYFTGTQWLRWMTAIGTVLILTGAALLIYLPQGTAREALAVVGVFAFFMGSSLMPLMFGQLARSHYIYTLPLGRLKLFASALLTTLLVSAPLPVLAALALMEGTVRRHPEVQLMSFLGTPFFWQMYVSVLLVCSWLYAALWFATSSRTAAGLMRALVVLIAIIAFPSRRISTLETSIGWTLLHCTVTWSVFALYFFFPAYRWKTLKAAVLDRFERRAGVAAAPELQPQQGVELMLGATRPWLLPLMQVFPVLLAAKFILSPGSSPSTWLYYLTLFSAVSGAITSLAAVKSRALWLRAPWSRAQLFARVETLFWRHNSYSLGVLLVLLVALSTYLDLPAVLLALGAPLIVLGVVTSTYLGLMMTRGLAWLESLLAIGAMMLMMAIAILAAAEQPDVALVAGLEVLLLIAAIAFRLVAKRRWTRIDWTLCRPEIIGATRA